MSGNWKVKVIEIYLFEGTGAVDGRLITLGKIVTEQVLPKSKTFQQIFARHISKSFYTRKVLMSRYVSKSKYDHLLAMCARQDIQKTSRGMMSETSKRLNKEYEKRNNKRNLDGWCRKPGTRLATAPHGLRRRRSRTWKFTFNICIWVFEYFFCVFKSLCVYESLYFCVCLVGE